jgi:cell division protein FtsA
MIEIVPFGRNETRGLSKEILCDIMQPRAIELMQHVAKEVSTAKHQISGGVFLAGGGARVRGLAEIAEQVFDAPTRIGVPEPAHFGGLANEISGPEWATASGLALLSMKAGLREGTGRSRSSASRVAEWFGGLKEKFR